MESPTQVPALELRISISETEPLIWRQLVLPESATVADLHAAIQCAFGWKDCHLYGLTGPDRTGKTRFVTVIDFDAPEDAEAARDVRLLELFDPSSPGKSELEYEYDFGDSWTHEIDVVGPTVLPENTFACTDGAMRGPIEDSGGVHGYANVVRVVGNPKHPEHRQAVEWLELVTQESLSEFDPTAFDLAEVNGQLQRLAKRFWSGAVTDEDRQTVLGPVLWFLRAADPDGLPLTSAGYLKPAFVKRAMTELGWDDTWISSGRVEVSTSPIRNLREQLQTWKLLRKSKDKLLLTPRGRALVNDPEQLWDYLVDLLANPGTAAEQVGTPVVVHWKLTGDEPPYRLRYEAFQAALHHGGLRTSAGNGEIPVEWARDLYHEIQRSLHRLELWEGSSWGFLDEKLSDAGIKFLLDVQSRWA